ncbi:MAG: CPBP family intramembrane metalloprotease [Aquificota bacterium]|nr:CPBP family intramembrane metalloprotease [Aquificota bacterium]
MGLPVLFEDPEELGLRNFGRGLLFGLPFFSLGVCLMPDTVLVLNQLGVALVEEVFFRGFLMARMGNVPTSMVFTGAHVVEGLTLNSLLVFFPSLVLGYVYLKTGSLLAPVLLHSAMNLLYLRLVEEFPELYRLLKTELTWC